MRIVRTCVNDSRISSRSLAPGYYFSSPEPSPAVVCITMSKIACLLPFPFVDSAKVYTFSEASMAFRGGCSGMFRLVLNCSESFRFVRKRE